MQKSAYKGDGTTPIPHEDEMQFDNQTPSSTMKEINSNGKGKMAASVGKPSSLVYYDISDANYASLKIAIQSSDITSAIRFNDLFNKVLKLIRQDQIEAGVAIGEIEIADYNSNKRTYHKVTARRISKINIEPLKTSKADEMNFKNEFMSHRDIASANGKEIEQIIEENYELKFFKKMMKKQIKKKYKKLKIEKEVSE